MKLYTLEVARLVYSLSHFSTYEIYRESQLTTYLLRTYAKKELIF